MSILKVQENCSRSPLPGMRHGSPPHYGLPSFRLPPRLMYTRHATPSVDGLRLYPTKISELGALAAVGACCTASLVTERGKGVTGWK